MATKALAAYERATPLLPASEQLTLLEELAYHAYIAGQLNKAWDYSEKLLMAVEEGPTAGVMAHLGYTISGLVILDLKNVRAAKEFLSASLSCLTDRSSDVSELPDRSKVLSGYLIYSLIEAGEIAAVRQFIDEAAPYLGPVAVEANNWLETAAKGLGPGSEGSEN